MDADFDRIVSPVSVAHFSQYKLTRLLIEQLKHIGFHVSSDGLLNTDDIKLAERQILLGHECTSINATEDGLTVTASVTREGEHVEKKILCNFLVGTDGAGSTVRKLVGIGMSGEHDLQKLISIHFTSQDLGQYLMNERPGMLFFIFNTEAIGVLVAHDLTQGEFVLQVLYIQPGFRALFSCVWIILVCYATRNLDFWHFYLMQVPFYPPQQRFEDFSSRVTPYLCSLQHSLSFLMRFKCTC